MYELNRFETPKYGPWYAFIFRANSLNYPTTERLADATWRRPDNCQWSGKRIHTPHSQICRRSNPECRPKPDGRWETTRVANGRTRKGGFIRMVRKPRNKETLLVYLNRKRKNREIYLCGEKERRPARKAQTGSVLWVQKGMERWEL